MSDSLPIGQRRGRTRLAGRNKRSTNRKPYNKFANPAVDGEVDPIVAEHEAAAAAMLEQLAQLPIHAGDVVKLTAEALDSPDNADITDDERAALASWRGTVSGVRVDDDMLVADFEGEDPTGPLDLFVVVDQVELDAAKDQAEATAKAEKEQAAAAAKAKKATAPKTAKATPAAAETKVVAAPKKAPQEPKTTAETK